MGVQFRIGPTIGSRFKYNHSTEKFELLGEVDSGDISLHLPRRDGPGGDRGGYLVSLKWFKDNVSDDGGVTNRIAEAGLGKEIPHATYGDVPNFRNLEFLPGWPNPREPIEKKQIRDGLWHSFLGVIYNDWHRGKTFVTSDVFPIIGLWYSHKATSDFKDFRLLGMATDIGNMEPRGPLKEEIGKDQHPIIDLDDLLDFPDDIHEVVGTLDDIFLPGVGKIINFFGGDVVGDDIAVAEHALQIRIDDVPLNEIEIRNVYAASVKYIGIPTPLQGSGACSAQAKAVIDAQVKVEDLKRQATDARKNMIKPGIGFGGPQFNVWREILENLQNVEIPNARSDLRAAEFIYGRCIDSLKDFADHPGG